MTTLTATASRVYNAPTGAKSPVGATTSVNQEAFSRSIDDVAFFMPVIIWHSGSPSLWVLFGAEPAQAGEGRHLLGTSKGVDGCGNSLRYPPYLITTGLLGNNKPTKKVLIMTEQVAAFLPEDCFALAANVDPTKLYDPIYLLLERARASVSLMQDSGEDLNEGFTVPHQVVMSSLGGIYADLAQVSQLLESQSDALFDATREAREASK